MSDVVRRTYIVDDGAHRWLVRAGEYPPIDIEVEAVDSMGRPHRLALGNARLATAQALAAVLAGAAAKEVPND